MELKVSEQKKQLFYKNLLKKQPKLNLLVSLKKIFFFISLPVSALYGLICFGMPGYKVVSINGLLQKDKSAILIEVMMMFLITIALGFIFNSIMVLMIRKNQYDRVDERIIVENGVIRYIFRIKYHSYYDYRNVVLISINKIQNISLNNINGITFIGEISSDNVQLDLAETVQPQSENLNSFVIYDYFEPSLMEVLSTYKYEIEMEN